MSNWHFLSALIRMIIIPTNHRTRSGRSGEGCVRPQMGHKTPLFAAATLGVCVFGLGVRLLRCAEISEHAEPTGISL